MKLKELKHLYWRAGFGIQPEILISAKKDRQSIVNDLMTSSRITLAIGKDLSYLNEVDLKDKIGNRALVKKLLENGKMKIQELNYSWIKRLIKPEQLLREKMTLFWANHFVCRDSRPHHIQNYNNALRVYALGDFRAFVKAISKEASMLKYLNGNKNRKAKPNENFARELMELFTLGIGNYTEKDIKEAARSFTGYAHNFRGDFFMRNSQQDKGQKIFFGKTGNFDGDDIIDIILDNKQCARFISDKIYRHFVNPKPNKKHIEAMTNVFYRDYNIEDLMRFVFMSDWFYNEENIGAKIKSPVELLIGMVNTIPVKFERKKDLLKIQRLLGQTLFNPQSVEGWKGDKAWIDANTIMVRLKLPSLLFNNAMISLKEKGDFSDNFRGKFFKRGKNKLPFKTLPDWEVFSRNFQIIDTESLAEVIIQGDINKGTSSYLKTLSKKSKRDYCIQLMSLPEYQMC